MTETPAVRWPVTPDTQAHVADRKADHYGELDDFPWGDGPCGDCGDLYNIRWHTPSVFWNRVMAQTGDEPGIICIPCFVVRVHSAGLAPIGFALIPEFHWETSQERAARRTA